MPVIFRASFKPNPTLGRSVNAINCSTLENTVTGENSAELACLVPSYVPAVEAAAAIAVLGYMVDYPNF